MAKKPTPVAPTTPKTQLALDIRAALDSIPDGPYWATYADICLIMGRLTSHALAIASAASKVDGFVRWDQVRNSEGVFRAMKGTDGVEGRLSVDAAGKVVRHDTATIAKWARARGIVVGANGRADKSQQIRWTGTQWVLVKGGAAVTAKPAKKRAARKAAAKPAAVEVAPVVDAPVAEVAPVVEQDAEVVA
ncbi:MAG: hypothetical protein EHM24_11265 [Acidobacteria bacterium]|nr:MAG: hypothetical protein EHM24_11265 [Acidobacteriota bacterium]